MPIPCWVAAACIALASLPAPSAGIALDPSMYYRLESRDDGWVAERAEDGSIILGACKHEPKMRFSFAPDGEYYAISTESHPGDVLTVSGASPASRAAVVFEPDAGADHQRWQVEDRGDGYVAILNRGSGLAFGHTVDTTPLNPIENDGTGAQFLYDGSSPNLDWLVAESHPVPYDSIGVNQNGWAPAQRKTAVFTRAAPTGIPPSFLVTGPQPLGGSMTRWGKKWGHEFYTVDLTSLTAVGRYTIEADAQTAEFDVFEGPFRTVRGSRGGELTWGDMVDGFLATQTAPSPTGLDEVPQATGDEVIGTWAEIAGAPKHVMTDGWYDATSRDSKTARSATAAKFLALASMEAEDSGDVSDRSGDLLPALQMAVDHLSGDQNADGSFPLGKFRTNVPTNPGYHWSVDTDAGITARHVTTLAVLAQALEASDPGRSVAAREAAERGWWYLQANPENFKIDDPTYAGLLQDYYGNQANVVKAAIELFLLTGDPEYSSFADARVAEGTYKRGKYERDGSPAWPGTATVSKMDDMVDANTVLHLCRYLHVASDAAMQSKLDGQIGEWNAYWQSKIDTPWGVPESGGAAGVRSGWSRNLASLAPQFLCVGRCTGRTDAIDAGTAILDYILGNNAVVSSFYMGAGHNNFHPRFKYSSERTKGAIIPGIKTEGGLISLLDQASKTGESVTMQTTPVLLALAHADALYPPPSLGRRPPIFYAGTIEAGDAFLGESYVGQSLADAVLDPDGSGDGASGVWFEKGSGPAWLTVSAGGALGGTPDLAGPNEFVVRATIADGQSSMATLVIDVKTETVRATLAPIHIEVSEDAYVKESAPSTNFGQGVALELRKDVDTNNYARVAYLKFVVEGLDTQPESAVLRLYAPQETDEIHALAVPSGSWDETSVTWNDRPTDDTAFVGSGRAPSASYWLSIDISGHVTGDGTYAFMLEGEKGNGKDVIGSREGGHGAYLDIVVSAAAGA